MRTSTSRHTRDRHLARIAGGQALTFSRAQALAAGFNDPTIRRRVRAGLWERPHPGVYRFAGAPPSWTGDLWAALLAAGSLAAITHESSVRLHGSRHVPPHPLTLTVPHGAHPRVAGATVHQIDDLRPHHLVVVDGLPVSEPARAVVELAAVVGPRRLGLVLDDLVFDRRTTNARVSARLREVARPGKPGVTTLGRVLDDRADESVPLGSELERALVSTLVAGGLPMPERQLPLPGRGAVDGVVDAAYPAWAPDPSSTRGDSGHPGTLEAIVVACDRHCLESRGMAVIASRRGGWPTALRPEPSRGGQRPRERPMISFMISVVPP